jgi:hypothetical protein
MAQLVSANAKVPLQYLLNTINIVVPLLKVQSHEALAVLLIQFDTLKMEASKGYQLNQS